VGIAFGVTSKGVYFQSNAKTIQFFDTATGKISTIAELDRPMPGPGHRRFAGRCVYTGGSTGPIQPGPDAGGRFPVSRGAQEEPRKTGVIAEDRGAVRGGVGCGRP
jgi:hypothetical protein